MNLTEIAAADAAHLLDHSGQHVTHYPRGRSTGNTVTAIVDLDPVTGDEQRGETHITRGRLQVDEALTVHRDDRWTIEAIDYETERVGGYDGAGLRTVHVVRGQPLSRRRQ